MALLEIGAAKEIGLEDATTAILAIMGAGSPEAVTLKALEALTSLCSIAGLSINNCQFTGGTND